MNHFASVCKSKSKHLNNVRESDDDDEHVFVVDKFYNSTIDVVVGGVNDDRFWGKLQHC